MRQESRSSWWQAGWALKQVTTHLRCRCGCARVAAGCTPCMPTVCASEASLTHARLACVMLPACATGCLCGRNGECWHGAFAVHADISCHIFQACLTSRQLSIGLQQAYHQVDKMFQPGTTCVLRAFKFEINKDLELVVHANKGHRGLQKCEHRMPLGAKQAVSFVAELRDYRHLVRGLERMLAAVPILWPRGAACRLARSAPCMRKLAVPEVLRLHACACCHAHDSARLPLSVARRLMCTRSGCKPRRCISWLVGRHGGSGLSCRGRWRRKGPRKTSHRCRCWAWAPLPQRWATRTCSCCRTSHKDA